jgi:leader peptidase (prepilin peptidase) / N-methyltransferase
VTTQEIEAKHLPVRPANDWPVVAAGAFVGLLCLVHAGFGGAGVLAAFVAFVLVRLAAIDLRTRLLPNRIVLPTTVVALLAHAVLTPTSPEWLLAALGAGLVFLVPALLRPGALGMGDVKLAMLLGATVGYSVVTALCLGLFAAGLFAMGFVLVRGRAAMKSDIALGPFLALGGLVAMLVG